MRPLREGAIDVLHPMRGQRAQKSLPLGFVAAEQDFGDGGHFGPWVSLERRTATAKRPCLTKLKLSAAPIAPSMTKLLYLDQNAWVALVRGAWHKTAFPKEHAALATVIMGIKEHVWIVPLNSTCPGA
jgi:hypothetical protein